MYRVLLCSAISLLLFVIQTFHFLMSVPDTYMANEKQVVLQDVERVATAEAEGKEYEHDSSSEAQCLDYGCSAEAGLDAYNEIAREVIVPKSLVY